VAVLKFGGMYDHVSSKSLRINEGVALLAFDLFANGGPQKSGTTPFSALLTI